MNKEELIGKLQMVYVGDTNALNELIGYYDGLKQENQKLKEQLEKANKKIEKMFDDGDENKVIDDLIEIQKILDKGE